VLGFSSSTAQNLILNCRSSNKRQIVRAIWQPNCPDNLIARRIVRRLELKTESSCPAVKAEVWGPNHAPPTRDSVNIACSPGDGGDYVTCRFYIVKNCSFDLLFGSTSSSNSNLINNPR
jgi:hypothetical protein